MERHPLIFFLSFPLLISFTYCLLFIGPSLPFFMHTLSNFLSSLCANTHSLNLKHFVSHVLAFLPIHFLPRIFKALSSLQVSFVHRRNYKLSGTI